MARYAEGTTVPAERSQQEITALLRGFGARNVAVGWGDDRAVVEFEARARRIRIMVALPVDASGFTRTATGRARTRVQAETAWQAEIRRCWRALLLVLKAKLEIVESGITDFDREFLANTVLPDGSTVYEHTGPAIEQAYATGLIPALLPRAIESAPRRGER